MDNNIYIWNLKKNILKDCFTIEEKKNEKNIKKVFNFFFFNLIYFFFF
jgi:cobalamin biosynthesis protein CbiG